MKIHSDKITISDMYDAARKAGVTIDEISTHGSQTRKRAFKFYVLGSSSHRPNQRNYGPDDYAATWDEWGILLGHQFSVDPSAHTGRYGYRSAEDFHDKTVYRFLPGFLTREQMHKQHKWTVRLGYENYCDCGAGIRWSDSVPGPIESSKVAYNL
jgi:hypothetical protein